jgi:hypothetical protein
MEPLTHDLQGSGVLTKQVGGRRERSVLRTQATEDAEMRRSGRRYSTLRVPTMPASS